MIPKFRAWHKKEKKMCSVEILTKNGCFLLGILPEHPQIYNGGKYVVEASKDGKFCTLAEFILMQSTGHVCEYEHGEDRELFEGDLASVIYETPIDGGEFPDPEPNRDEYFGVVVWNKENLAWALETKEDGMTQLHTGCSIMIHGNKYENPELLEGSQ